LTARSELTQLSTILANPRETDVLLGARDTDGDIEFRRLTINNAVREQFQQRLAAALGGLGDRLVPYEPAYKPEEDELLYVDLDNEPALRAVIGKANDPGDLESYKDDDEFIATLRMTATRVSTNPAALFLQAATPRQQLKRSRFVALTLMNNVYQTLADQSFLFETKPDCIATAGYVFIRTPAAFESMFGYMDKLRKRAQVTLRRLKKLNLIANFDDFEQASDQPQLARKLAGLDDRAYLDTLTISDIRKTVKRFRLTSEIQFQGDKLVFEGSPSKRWLIPRILDDDYLDSGMTQAKYEVNSKRAR
jgi:hypothetical protein